MADPSLVATAQATNANAYVSRSDAQSYLDGRLDIAEWTDATAVDTDRSLIMATGRLDIEGFVGSPTSFTQRLQWPRGNVPDPWGSYYASDTIPRIVEEATAELALAYLKSGASLDDTGLEQFANVKVGPLDVTPRISRKGDALPNIVRRILRNIMMGAGDLNVPLEKS